MALADRILADRKKVFLREDQYAKWHTWNGKRFLCVTDEDEALKRKNNNVNDISWDNNTSEVLIYVAEEDFPGRAEPNTYGYYDGKYMRILQVGNDEGMLQIMLVTNTGRSVDE